jgi:hypothetical protein
MKKLIVFALALFSVSYVFAQSSPAFGIKGGLNVSNLKVTLAPGNQTPEKASRLGIHLGVLAHVHIAPSWGIQPELQYSSEGMEQTYGGSTFDWKLNYLNIPVMLQYMFSNGFRLEAGPQLGFLLNGKIEDNTGATSVTKDFKSVNLGLGFGLNYLTYSGFGVGGRYVLGVSNINKSETASDNKDYTRTGQISVFYMLDRNHKAASRR